MRTFALFVLYVRNKCCKRALKVRQLLSLALRLRAGLISSRSSRGGGGKEAKSVDMA